MEHEAAGSIRFINSNQAVGRTKFYYGPDLARGPDFGHACIKGCQSCPFRNKKPQKFIQGTKDVFLCRDF